MATRIMTERGLSTGKSNLGSVAEVRSPMAEKLDQAGNADRWLDANEIGKASTRDLLELLGELDGEAYVHDINSRVPVVGLPSKAKMELAYGAGDVVWNELKSRGTEVQRVRFEPAASGQKIDRVYELGLSHMVRYT